jgi:hypothetical protein
MIGARLVGGEAEQRRIRALSLAVSDLRRFWPMLVPVVSNWWKRQFETSGAFGGRPWAPLTEPYGDYKATKAPGKPLLVYSSGLKRAAARPIRTQSPRTLILTIDDSDYGHGPDKVKRSIVSFHQEGTPRMVARPIVFGDPLPAEAQGELQAVAESYLTDFLRRLG